MAKIMLVEDDTNLAEIYQARLTAEGYQIVSAPDGEAALALAAKEKPDLIISDVMMPKISGFEMLDILRNTEGLKSTKVIMLTALGQAEDKSRAEGLGADRYLVKSQVTLEDIVKAVQELLSETAGAPAATTPAAPAPTAPAAPSTAAPAAATPAVPAPAAPAAQPVPVAVQPTLAPAAPATATPPPAPVPTTIPVATPPAPAMPTAPTAPAPTPNPTPVQPAVTTLAPSPAQTASAADDKLVSDAVNDLLTEAAPTTKESAETPPAPAVSTAAPAPTPAQSATPPAPTPDPSATPSPALPTQSSAQEESAVQKQIANFAGQSAAEATPSTAPQSGSVGKPPTLTDNDTDTNAAESENDRVPIAHKKVIRPISDVTAAKPSLDSLLADEARKNPEAATATPMVTGDTQGQSVSKPAPHAPHPPGQVIMPDTAATSPNTGSPIDPSDPANIAL